MNTHNYRQPCWLSHHRPNKPRTLIQLFGKAVALIRQITGHVAQEHSWGALRAALKSWISIHIIYIYIIRFWVNFYQISSHLSISGFPTVPSCHTLHAVACRLVAAEVHGAGVSAIFGSAKCRMSGLCQAWDLDGLRDDATNSRWGWGMDPHGSTWIHGWIMAGILSYESKVMQLHKYLFHLAIIICIDCIVSLSLCFLFASHGFCCSLVDLDSMPSR